MKCMNFPSSPTGLRFIFMVCKHRIPADEEENVSFSMLAYLVIRLPGKETVGRDTELEQRPP